MFVMHRENWLDFGIDPNPDLDPGSIFTLSVLKDKAFLDIIKDYSNGCV